MSYSPTNQTPHVGRHEDVTSYLWTSKDWADITVVCANNREIKAHRAVICVRSQFSGRCFKLGFVEAETGRITLTEEFEIIESLLQFLYGVQVNLLQSLESTEHDEDTQSQNLEGHLKKLIHLYSSSDKVCHTQSFIKNIKADGSLQYAVEELQGQVANVFAARLVALKDPNTILNMAAAVYSQTPFFDIQLRNAVLTHVQQNLDSILSEEDTSSALLENTAEPGYLEAHRTYSPGAGAGFEVF
ncbi:hypothetical protein SLS57_002905 [Botryosphaeria dothidea]